MLYPHRAILFMHKRSEVLIRAVTHKDLYAKEARGGERSMYYRIPLYKTPENVVNN